MSKKFILFTFFIAIFLLSCRTLQEGVVVAVITHNLHGTLNPSPYRGDFEDYPEPPKKEIKKKEPKTIKEEKPVQTPYVPRYKIELTDAGYVVVLSKPIIFASSEMTMNRKYEDSIDMVLEFLDDYTNAKLIVEGHPDKLSDASYGYMLSRVRASSVCDELIDSEIDGNRLLFYQNNTRIDNASVSMDNESIKFVVINDKNAYAHYLSYLRNYASKYPESLLVKEALPTDLKKPLSDAPSLVLKSGDGSVISKTPSKKSKEDPTTKKVVAKEDPAPKKVKAKKDTKSKKIDTRQPEPKEEIIVKEQLPQHIVEKVGTLNLLQPTTPIIFTESASGIPLKYTNSINDIIRFMNANTNVRLVIEGYGDKTTNSNDNIKLSENRGSSVYRALLRSGIEPNRLLLHGSSADLNNVAVLADNNSMRFIVIKNSYDYYDYVKYLREYKMKLPATNANETSDKIDKVYKPDNTEKTITKAKMINPNNNTDIFEFSKDIPIKEGGTKKVIAKEEPAPKKVVAKKEPATKKVVAKEEPATKKVVAKEEPTAKKVVAKKEPTAKKVVAKKTDAKQPEPKEEMPKAEEKALPQYKIENFGNLKVISPKSPIEFKNGSSLIEAKSISSIKDIVDFLNDNTNARIAIEGYNDKTDSSSNDIKLSENRGDSVYKALLRSGIEPNRLLLHGSSDDINNANVLADNDSMRFVVINNSYDYYNYIKYLRDYKPTITTPTPVAVDKKTTKPSVLNPLSNPDIFDTSKDSDKNIIAKEEPAPKKVVAKKEPATKKVVAKKEPATKQAKAVKEPATKKVVAKKEPVPKQAKKGKSQPEDINIIVENNLPEYIVEKVNNLYILNTSRPIKFNEGLTAVPVQYTNSINDIIHFMNANTNARIAIEGYGDKIPEPEKNIKLSEDRGENIYKILLKSGLDENRLLLHTRTSDINNANILMDNSNMRFVVIKDRYDYYNYIKYLRDYKPKNTDKIAVAITTTDKDIKDLNKVKLAKEVDISSSIELFDFTDEKAPATKQAKVVKEPTTKKEPAAKKAQPTKQAKAKKEPAPKQAKANKKTAAKNDIQEVVKVKAETNLKMEYRVLQSGSLYILLEQKPIMFNKGASTINEKRHNESIDYIISFLNASTNSKLVIEGYSDKTGTSNDYVAISKARGYSVYKKLTDSGIAENRLLLYGSNNDINNAHVLLDNNGMRFIIIKDSYAYYSYVNYLRKYIPEAKPIAAPPTIDIKKPTTTAINNKNVIPLNDTNASIVIITEDEYKKEIALANAEKESKEKPVVDEVNEKATKSKKAPPTKQAKVVKEPTAKKAPPTKQAKVVKEPTTKKAPPTKQAKVVKEPTTKKAPPNKNVKNTRETSPSINESPKVSIENKGYRIELSNGLQVLLPPDSIAFDYQSAIVDTRYKSSIKHIADFLKENPEAKMVIEGNAYESGTDSYNTILSRARANAVYNELLKGGIDRNRLLLHSVGNKIRSVNGNSPKENRIIRFVIIKTQNDYSKYLDFLKRAGV